VRTAPDDLQDGGQGNVIVGDDAFKRPDPHTTTHIAVACGFPLFSKKTNRKKDK